MANRNSTPHSTRVAIYARVSTTDQSTDFQLTGSREVYLRGRMNPLADRQAWRAMIHFFEKAFN